MTDSKPPALPSAISLWDSLPLDEMKESGLDALKSGLENFLEEKQVNLEPGKALSARKWIQCHTLRAAKSKLWKP